MQLTDIRTKAFLDRYSLKDKEGNPVEKTPQEMWQRVSGGIAGLEKAKVRKEWSTQFNDIMQDFKYVPGGRILAGAGTGYKITYYNCFVIPSPKDSRDGILETLKQMVEIMARGGGVGINLSSLRPRGARVRKVNGFSSGPCNWAELFSVATRDIIQQGGTRRGALMLMLWDWHPDIEEFITVKTDLSRINGANLSVCVSDAFMTAVKNDADWDLIFPDTNDPEYDTLWKGYMHEWLEKKKPVKVYKTIKARALWDMIAQAAWRSAEPGVVFMERYNKENNNWYWNYINCVNPCGEEGLPAWGVCNLGSLNLSAFVIPGKTINDPGAMNYEELYHHAKVAVRFQDDVVDGDIYIFDGIRQTQLNGERRIGLGTMGLGDALIKMHLRYGSDDSLPIIDKIYRTIRDAAYEASVELAKEKGAFPKFNANKYLQGLFIKRLPEKLREGIKKHGIRNSILLMQAPTGTTSLMAGTTSGIEPVYEFEFLRRSRLGEDIIRHPLYDEWFQNFKKTHNRDPKKEDRPSYFVSANDLTPEDHVKVQAAIQTYVDASISKTVNAPNAHTVDDVKRLYTLAYDMGCKGITYMREGSRQGVLERVEEKKADAPVKIEGVSVPQVKPRPMRVDGSTYQIETPVGRAYVTVNTNGNNQPLEVFVNVGKAGSDVSAMAEGIGRLISLILRIASPLSALERAGQIVKELSGIGGSRHLGFGDSRVRSLPDAISKVLKVHFDYLAKTHTEKSEQSGNGHTVVAAHADTVPVVAPAKSISTADFDLCPECGVVSLAYEEGCKKCYSCGYSEC